MNAEIVACISEKTAAGCIREIKRAAKRGASIAELRLDYLDMNTETGGIKAISEILHASPIPVIATYRRKTNGGLFDGDEKKRIETLKYAINAGAKYVDVELDILESDLKEIKMLSEKSRCNVIVSQHDFEGTPDSVIMLGWLRKAANLGDIVKIVSKANSAEDCTRMLQLLGMAEKEGIPAVIFAMGEKGKFTRAACLLYGSKWTYVATTKAVACGQISVADMKKVLDVLL